MWTFPAQQIQLQHSLIELYQRPGARALDQMMRALRDCAGCLLTLPFVVAASWLLIGQVMGYRQRRRIE